MGPPGETTDKGDKPPPLMSLQVSAPKEDTPREVKLPQALEQALAFKTERAKQVRGEGVCKLLTYTALI